MPDKLRMSDLMEIKNAPDGMPVIPMLAELGKLKIGRKGSIRKTRTGKDFQQPEKMDYFTVTTLVRGEDGNFLPDQEMMKRLGKPRALEIILPYDDIGLNYQSSYAWYSASKCRCRGNGERRLRWNEQRKLYVEDECLPEKCSEFIAPEPLCKTSGVLSVILVSAQKVGGVYKFRHTSIHSDRNIRSALLQIQTITHGILAGIPLWLTVTPQQVRTRNNQSTVAYIVNIEWKGSIQDLLEYADKVAQRRAQSRINLTHYEEKARLMLTSAPPETDVEAQEVAEEWYPEAVMAELQNHGEPPEPPQETPPTEEIPTERILPTAFSGSTPEMTREWSQILELAFNKDVGTIESFCNFTSIELKRTIRELADIQTIEEMKLIRRALITLVPNETLTPEPKTDGRLF